MIWKITPVVLLVLFLIFVKAEAQKHPQFRYISFDAGFNMAGISSSYQYDKYEKNFGANISLSGNYSFSDSKSIGASLAFEQKGAVDHIFDIKTNLNYFSVPVYMKWVTGTDPRFFLITGAYAAWLINANRRGEKIVDGQLTRIDENVTSDFQSLDYGFIFGTGMMVRLYDDFDFLLTLRGSAGLPGIDNQQGYRPRNYHLNISIGYIYYIGFR